MSEEKKVLAKPSLLPLDKAILVLQQIPQERIVSCDTVICSSMRESDDTCSVVEIKVVFNDEQKL